MFLKKKACDCLETVLVPVLALGSCKKLARADKLSTAKGDALMSLFQHAFLLKGFGLFSK